jgi:hypothetical protein
VARAHHTLVHERCLCHFDGTCSVFEWPDLPFHHGDGSATMFSSSWCGMWRRLMDNLSPMVISCFFPSFLSHIQKSTCLSSLFLVFQFHSLFFWFLIFVLSLFIKFCLFSIYSFNYNLLYIIFTNSILIILISSFFSLTLSLKFY